MSEEERAAASGRGKWWMRGVGGWCRTARRVVSDGTEPGVAHIHGACDRSKKKGNINIFREGRRLVCGICK